MTQQQVYFIYRYNVKCSRCLRYMNPDIYEQHTNGQRCLERYVRRTKKVIFQ